MTATYEAGWYLADRDGKTLRVSLMWGSAEFRDDGGGRYMPHVLTDIRPAIVLDPNDADVRRFAAAWGIGVTDAGGAVGVARQVAVQMTPAHVNPPEPAEFGSVVRDSDGRFWLLSRVDGGRDRAWVTDDSTAGHVWRAFYANINVVEVVRVGLS